MSQTETLRNAYTDEPELHPNLILGSFQLLWWMVFHPTAWRNHLKRIDPILDINILSSDPDSNSVFPLPWHNSEFQKFLLQELAVVPIFEIGFITIMFLALGYSVPEVLPRVAMGIVGGMAGGAAGGMAGNLAYSIVVGIVSSVVGSVAYGVVMGIMASIAVGLTGGITATITTLDPRNIEFNTFESITIGIFTATVIGIATGIAVGVAEGVAGDVAGSVALGMVIGVAMSIAESIFYGLGTGFVMGVVGGVTYGIAYGIAFGVGSTIQSWQPYLVYPFVLPLNVWLYVLDAGRKAKSPCWLRYHPAFWNEWQYLPLQGLEKHLLFVLDNNPAEGKAAFDYLSTSKHQRWAAISVQIELEARQLERCQEVGDIADLHSSLSVGELASPARSLLDSFSNISKNTAAALKQSSTYNQRLALDEVADRLNNFTRELKRSTDKYAPRFLPISESWHEIVKAYAEELTKITELRQEIDNPYITGLPLTQQQKIFTGRTDTATYIEKLILDRRRPPLLLYGQRRMGKTSLLNNLGRLLPNTIVPLFIDLQGATTSTNTEAGFLYNLARGIVKSGKEQRIAIPSLTRETVDRDPFTTFDEWLDTVEETLGENAALLALDEFEKLDEVLATGKFDEAAVLGMLRNLIQHRPRFKVMISGSHTLEELQRWSSYLINVQVIHISYLKEHEARQLIERPVKDFTLGYEQNAADRAYNLTRGHPFLVQLLCGEIVALKNEQDPAVRRLATLTDVEAAIPEALQSGALFFADIDGNQIDNTQRNVLKFIAAQGEGKTVSKSVLCQEFGEATEEAIAHLIRRELIEEKDGGYGFQVELIRRWFV